MSKISKEQELLNEIERLHKQLEISNNRVKKAKYGLIWMEIPEAFELVKPRSSFFQGKEVGVVDQPFGLLLGYPPIRIKILGDHYFVSSQI